MKRQLRYIFITLVITSIIIWGMFVIPDRLLKLSHPVRYQEYVFKFAQESSIDPYLVLAIIKVESGFDAKATSPKGAKGLMQLMDSTAEEAADKLQIQRLEGMDLYNPEMNIRLGCAYFAYLEDCFQGNDGNRVLALMAYNAGITRVQTWLQEGKLKTENNMIYSIPFAETDTYVRRVIREYKVYKKLYEGEVL